ncbi:MAG: hypothetical protein II740_05190 [Lachnospiraceae bacterium]|nr:hypothetical protein [Lachnospiraceae bacterium]
MITALIIFVLMYVGMLAFSKYRVWIALSAAALMVILGVLPLGNVFGAINWNVIMMIAGTMGIVSLFIESGMPSRLSDMMLMKVPNAATAIVALAVFSGWVVTYAAISLSCVACSVEISMCEMSICNNTQIVEVAYAVVILSTPNNVLCLENSIVA